MRRSAAAPALAALTLLYCACVTPLAAANVTPAVSHTIATNSCLLLKEKVASRADAPANRSVSYNMHTTSLTLVWGSEPAHAAAALLAALLRYVLGYSDVRLLNTALATDELAVSDSVSLKLTGDYTKLVIGVSTAWEPKEPRKWRPHQNEQPGLAGPRLREFGVSSVPARRRLFARLSSRALLRPECREHVRWKFYANETELALCDFVDAATHEGSEFAAEVLGVGDCNATLQQLKVRAEAAATPLEPHLVNRTDFMSALRSTNRSLLFLDYDMWKGAPGVSVVEPPPCASIDFDCKLELDSSIAMRVADVTVLQTYAPELFQFVSDFKPSPGTLKLILERQASGVDIEEAVCEWALKNKSYMIDINLPEYVMLIFNCDCDPDNNVLQQIANIVTEKVRNQIIPKGWNITILNVPLNCSKHNDIIKTFGELEQSELLYRVLGVVSLPVENVAALSSVAAEGYVPLMLADVVPDDDESAASTWRVAPSPRHLARALHHLVLEAGWTRLAVLSQPTELATNYYAALNATKNQAKMNNKVEVTLGNFEIPLDLKEHQAQEVLRDLRAKNARIVFVNADSQAALTILAEAAAARMGYKDGVVWILREWRPNNVVNDTKHFTVSFWTRGVEDIPPAEGWDELHNNLSRQWPGQSWPPRAVALADALLTLSIGFKDVFEQYPHIQQDLRNEKMIRLLEESVIKKPVNGVSQLLRYKERSIEETFVFVDLWCDGKFQQRLATWRVNVTSGAVRGKNQPQASFSLPEHLPSDDGTSRCIIRTGDEFDPTCLDSVCAGALLLLALVLVAALLARRAFLQRLARLQQERLIQVIARRRHVATALAAYLVERDALELHHELGAGRFGSVRLARLRAPGRAPRYIAAKALRENAAPAEESEFLREACTIASLDHAHIVSLVGVCIADGPPLVLMELAFFGDLLQYMHARRHLVDGTVSEVTEERSEAQHVSAEALTRLAREAAEALQYLAMRGVVHRDLRAANCLVDVRRSLKLADFGMARDTVAGADGAPEYACRRRGLFPVLWMAPESLVHGVFSAASDVWALGVLVLELVTLGARPYGSMSTLRVLEYVAAGGSPPLPLDATPQTRGLVRLCWARAAERRPSAAEVAAYLSARPRALRPALLTEPVYADSGFGESHSTELLPPSDSPVHSLDQLEDLAATH